MPEQLYRMVGRQAAIVGTPPGPSSLTGTKYISKISTGWQAVSRASSLLQLIRVYLQEIGLLSGRRQGETASRR